MWQIILAIGLFFLILEIVVPTSFFINFAIACFLCAPISLFTTNLTYLVLAFVGLSFLSLYLIRPLFAKIKYNKTQETGVNSKYIGNCATVVEEITCDKGVISIYDERWQARCAKDAIIPQGEKVIIKNLEGLVAIVEKKEE